MKVFGISRETFPLSDNARRELSKALRWIQWIVIVAIAVATV